MKQQRQSLKPSMLLVFDALNLVFNLLFPVSHVLFPVSKPLFPGSILRNTLQKWLRGNLVMFSEATTTGAMHPVPAARRHPSYP